MIILLGDDFDKQYGIREFGANGAIIILETARKAEQRVIDERLLDDPVEETTICDDSVDSNVNMDSVMNKVEKLASDNDFSGNFNIDLNYGNNQNIYGQENQYNDNANE